MTIKLSSSVETDFGQSDFGQTDFGHLMFQLIVKILVDLLFRFFWCVLS